MFPTVSRNHRLFRALCLITFLTQAAWGLAVKSGTADELAAHLPSGMLYWRTSEFSGGLDNPPLGQLLVSALALHGPLASTPLEGTPANLWLTRLPNVLWAALLILLIGRLGDRCGGSLAGSAAAAACALSPNWIAHARLATLDFPVTALSLLAVVVAWAWTRTGGRGELALFGVLIGSAVLTKLTALHVLASITLAAGCLPGSPRQRLSRTFSLAIAGVVGVGLVAWLSYGPSDMSLGLPAPFVEAALGKLSHGSEGHVSTLFGERSRVGFPHYFFVVLATKVPIALLLALSLGVFATLRTDLVRDRRLVLFLVVPALWTFAAMSWIHRVHIGLRHILPLWPALVIVAGLGLAWLHGLRWGRPLLALVALSALFSAVSITPDHLSYFNELVRGPSGGSRVLSDSNLDWGQDEHRFQEWAKSNSPRVLPLRPTTGKVAVSVSALQGALQRDDRRYRWLIEREPSVVIGNTWRIYDIPEDAFTRVMDPLDALDAARWEIDRGNPRSAIALLNQFDLSRHERYSMDWWGTLAEAHLSEEHFEQALQATTHTKNVDRQAEIIFRVSNAKNTPWLSRDPQERERIFGALWRRGKRDEALEVANRRAREHPETVDPRYLSPGADTDNPTIEHSAFLKSLGLEREALREIGAYVALHPTDEDALWLYGELVVRRKLGASDFEWPTIDWRELATP